MVPVHSLVPHEKNYNKHPQSQIDLLIADLERFGQRKPIVVQQQDGQTTIVAGEGLWIAISQLAGDDSTWEHIWVTYVPEEWDEDQVLGFLVADNETKNGSVTDNLSLVELLSRQQERGYDLSSVGFNHTSYQDLVFSVRPPSLDALAEKYGEVTETTFWPTISLHVPPDTKILFDKLMAQAQGEEKHEKFAYLLECLWEMSQHVSLSES